jgi:hypothetical protein
MTSAPRSASGPRSVRQLLTVAAVIAVLLSLLASCQKGINVSALNRCGHAVEARADSIPETSVGWSKIDPAGRDHIATAVDSAKQLYVQVRSGKNDTPVEFVVAVATLPKPPAGVDDDVEIVLERDRCPKAG